MSEQLRKLDRFVYRVERLIVVMALVIMAVIVFLDVVHRTFADTDSSLAQWLVGVGRFAGAELPEEGSGYQAIEAAAPVILAGVFIGLTYFALRTAKRKRPFPAKTAGVLAIVGVAVAYGLVEAMIALVPHGFIWSQPLALILTLWVGFLGASMCTYERKHLRVEAIERYLPTKLRPWLALASGLATAGFCLFLTWASFDYVEFHYQEWVETEYKGGMFKGIDIPRWMGFSVLPVAFTIMAVRFVAIAIAASRGEGRARDTVADLVEAARQAEGDVVDEVQAGAPDAYPPSSVDTEAVSLEDDEERS